MNKYRYKVQDARCKLNGSRGFPCTLYLESCTPRFARGFSLVSAIFLLVVIAALGTFAVTLSTTQQQSAAQDVLGSRAFQAARAGIEWGAYQVLQNGGSCAASQTLAALPGMLAGFNVTVTCAPSASNPYDEAGTPVNMYQLTATAKQGTVGSPGYVERQMSVTIAR
jgi:MSHA biogenesis protein MshP